MYHGQENFTIKTATMPDCQSWAFAITKGVSASIRAGFTLYRKTNSTGGSGFGSFTNNFAAIVNSQFSLVYGSYSQWSWMGQMQYWELIKSRPLSDPTSWVGALTSILKEKYDALVDGFKDCPVAQLTNPYMSAYAFFKMGPNFLGLQNSTTSNSFFFLQVLGVYSPTYATSFKGADPSTYYGAGYSINDFVRMHTYRDLNVYKEIGRRAKIICADFDAKIGDFISVNQFVAANTKSKRALFEKHDDPSHSIVHSKAMLMDNHRDLTDAQAHRLAASFHQSFAMDKFINAECAPDFATPCTMRAMNTFIGGDF